ncbi:CDGSH iron-sulfur domain-containing protein 1 isoform X2 [Eptesicus fuscus]|uniref:CDGSH iron-sulfur domain-containing protein 1 isoform X2 n=1 Tax=Eptesicus fuscus TaxID=29078 RepID=UPI002403B319|nr:CDGSH iron-sulfur domain-containing protein 1 isoform X2 [Eptesicus fuscus]XP_054585232.1 CDGSH iron-sulfur domain-containing protein 1 isoform X2 [Eptesicus fuscus]XP_054585233.1 CDGSH iron-sulfur domain-containing protein 1 isoform X2 [Eptesicus fuscus]XP_054585234.1 CDGSH iron-sulfur domain-containing protein 1 isoform X2 [Eptesicus fuscus]
MLGISLGGEDARAYGLPRRLRGSRPESVPSGRLSHLDSVCPRWPVWVQCPVHTPCKRRRHEPEFQRTSPLRAGNRQLSSEAEANQTLQNFLLSNSLWMWVEWIAAVTIAAGTAAIGYLAYKKFYVKDHRNKTMVNLHIQKDDPKVVHAFDMEDLGDKAVYCRCWRSKKFPFCDGAHTKHNEETGDNVGPLIIKRKET